MAAHITAAAPGGPRYDPELRPKQRREASNGIWLCQTHAKLIDNDEVRYPSDLLREWKVKAEEAVLSQIGKPSSQMVLKAVVEECCLERGRGCIGIYNPTTRTIYAVYASITTSRSRGLLRLRWLGEPALEIDIDPGGRDTHRHIDLTEMHEGRRKLKLAWGFDELVSGANRFTLVIQARDYPDPTKQDIEIFLGQQNSVNVGLVPA